MHAGRAQGQAPFLLAIFQRSYHTGPPVLPTPRFTRTFHPVEQINCPTGGRVPGTTVQDGLLCGDLPSFRGAAPVPRMLTKACL